ncbi:GH32 C-terminal domain-containing protein [Vibrio vulnificus]|nr:GH32 C-terminal domain-containing protein [Vibrio vulnificus]
MSKLVLDMKVGDTLHFWVKANNFNDEAFLSLYSPSKLQPLCFRIKNVPQYFEFYSYEHAVAETVELEFELDKHQISLAYIYNPKTVEEEGVTFITVEGEEILLSRHTDIIKYYREDKLRPKLHFTPNSGWMNDPNGLCFHQGKYHLFYQYYPNSLDWGPMHWGHAVSENLMDWRHMPVFLQPEQNLESLGATGGAFSGTAFNDPNNDELSFFFTERKPAYDLNHSYREVQKRAFWDKSHVSPTQSYTVIDSQPEFVHHDFRDPKVWYDPSDEQYKMLLGSAVDKTPAILLYQSKDKENWSYHSVLYQAPEYFEHNLGRCVECPDFIQFGDIWVMIFGIVGYKEPATGRHNLLYAVAGSFEGNQFTALREPQCLDFATDFYAMQSFNDGKRQLAFAWLHNWAVSGNIHSEYNGELSVPRELVLNEDLELVMTPAKEVTEKFVTTHAYHGEVQQLEGIDQRVFGLDLQTDNKAFMLSLISESTMVEVGFDGESVYLVERDRDGKTSEYELRLGSDSPKFSAPTKQLNDLQLIFDHGIVELFCNGGRICGTRRYVNTLDCKHIAINGEFTNGAIRSIQ